ncbi:MCP four helix bundle domain-containing protein [Dyadobacter sp. CY347]|uniref:MCP four helix bundle domain-containing protein n=1 Tax=Dyadobacter sp. CY347 TaxID=2909336 RepID=UPI001F3CD582|nr:MCP four helix bundle domain-containing protein [Dyadobacter sp. CY347]MCF2487760.1 MCP four helix bundle domain-containing protein [Dyadobacter sp. CY347]
MKWSFVIRQKVKAAVVLAGILVVIMLASLSTNQTIQVMDQSLESVFVDRLQPAVDLMFLSENLYNRRLVVQGYLTDSSSILTGAPVKTPGIDNSERNRLISSFEKTSLTPLEAKKLSYFKDRLKAYDRLENSVLQLISSNRHQEAGLLFGDQGAIIFREAVSTLHSIAQIQSDAGKKTIKSAHGQAAGGLINISLLIAVCIVIGLVILNLLKNQSLVDQKSETFHLN